MDYCPKCENFLFADSKESQLMRVCRTCPYKKADENGGLVMETIVQERSSEGYKILLNEFTRQDPTLPHVSTLPCPNKECATNTGKQTRDVIIIKYDNQNLKFIYICNVCATQWRTRS